MGTRFAITVRRRHAVTSNRQKPPQRLVGNSGELIAAGLMVYGVAGTGWSQREVGKQGIGRSQVFDHECPSVSLVRGASWICQKACLVEWSCRMLPDGHARRMKKETTIRSSLLIPHSGKSCSTLSKPRRRYFRQVSRTVSTFTSGFRRSNSTISAWDFHPPA